MEQQTISVAKPGLVCSLRARCSIVAAQTWRSASVRGCANECPLSARTGLPPTLLSRFDLIFVLSDEGKGGPADSEIANTILRCGNQKGTTKTDERPPTANTVGRRRACRRAGDILNTASDDADFEAVLHRFGDYVALARRRPLPNSMEPAATELLQRYYARLRRMRTSTSFGGPATVRVFEGLLRLTEAHARVMYHDRVTLVDAVAVALLHQVCLRSQPGPSDASEASAFLAEALGPELPPSLRRLGLRADISCHAHYVAVEAALLAELGLAKNTRGAGLCPRRGRGASQGMPPTPAVTRHTPGFAENAIMARSPACPEDPAAGVLSGVLDPSRRRRPLLLAPSRAFTPQRTGGDGFFTGGYATASPGADEKQQPCLSVSASMAARGEVRSPRRNFDEIQQPKKHPRSTRPWPGAHVRESAAMWPPAASMRCRNRGIKRSLQHFQFDEEEADEDAQDEDAEHEEQSPWGVGERSERWQRFSEKSSQAPFSPQRPRTSQALKGPWEASPLRARP
eukprot:TRINITY_DN5305_c0_g1_i8.p1 TRINITY_DN5305_c0_g1~~TRINITY_DN5305_c0_g1_i8.p1  ORF type:complete len:514 (+),score=98.57 TRINITY_DN5305_c0_g1_i8:1517-3058(+)